MTLPEPPKATASHFYKYANPEHLEWLKTILLDHELYFPTLAQMNDPADGRPKLAALSDEQMFSFLYEKVVLSNPALSPEEKKHEAEVLRFNIPRHGAEKLLRIMSQVLYEQLEGYRVYSMSKRYDNLGMWAKYAADHSGYCLEFMNEGRPLTVDETE